MHNKTWSMEILPINSPDDLRKVTRGADLEIVQLKPGRLQGSIRHFGIGSLGIATGQFSFETRARGTMHREKVVLGTLVDSAGCSTHWWREIRPGDVGIFPPHVEIDVIHRGITAFLLVSIPLPELASMLASEEHLANPAFWSTKGVYRTNPRIGTEMLQRLQRVISGLEQKYTVPSDHAAGFLKRTIIESFVVGLMSALPSASVRSYTGARLVSETEDLIDAANGRPIHISELCSALKVSRRSLHRAFADTLGIGPAAYLRSRRLSAIQSVLSRSDPATISIPELAFEYGFPDRGRFTAYYRAHFGETPSETLHRRSAGARKLN